MAKKLTNPVPATIVMNDIDKQYVDRVIIDPAIIGTVDGNGDPNGSEIDLSRSGVTYNVTDVDINGHKLKAQQRTVLWADIPPAGRAVLRQMMNLLYQDAENAGLLREGTDSDDV